jgi:hypothetical protein
MAVFVNDVLDQIAATLHLQGGRTALLPEWTTIAAWGLGAGERDVYCILAGKGLSYLQVGGWRDLDAAVLQQSVYWTLVEGGPRLGDVPQEDIKLLDLREWLADPKTALLDAAGNLILADPSRLVGAGRVAGGWSDVVANDPTSVFSGIVDQTGKFRQL